MIADVAKALWTQHSNEESALLKGQHCKTLLSLRLFIDPDTKEGREQIRCGGLSDEKCRRHYRTISHDHDVNAQAERDDVSVASVDEIEEVAMPLSRMPRLAQIRDVHRRGVASSSGRISEKSALYSFHIVI